jgi:hypothetical protein
VSRRLIASLVLVLALAASAGSSASAAVLLSLSGGSGGAAGQNTYTVPGLVTVTQTPGAVYNNSTYYHIGYLFDGNTTVNNANAYWFGQHGSPNGPFHLTFAFTNPINLAYVTLFPHARTDFQSPSFSFDVSNDGVTWTSITNGLVQTSSVPVSASYAANGLYRYARLNVTAFQWLQYDGDFNEVQFFVNVPEPSAWLSLIGAAALLVALRRRVLGRA